jgi:hypothetical protein
MLIPISLALALAAPGPLQSSEKPEESSAGEASVRADTLRVEEGGPPAFRPTLGSPLADLAVRLRGRGEFGGDWVRFRPCDASTQLTCAPGLVPDLQPDIQVGVEVQGTISERVVVDVDYDPTREFAGANRFRLFYQGQEGEFLRRVEVGDVTFAFPETRFLTRGIPAGNFGILAQAGVGRVEFQTVFAQQQGARRTREFQLGGFGAEAGVIQQDTVVLDDAEYAHGQFFYLVDPMEITGAPHVDPLALTPGDVPAGIAPGTLPIQLYRMERDPILRQQVQGYVQADAEADAEGETVRESGWFRLLRPGDDYYTHPSGLWVALRAPLRPDEALAVTYVTAAGDTVGEYNPEQRQILGEVPSLRLIRASAAQHQPGRPTWDLEMKQVYRLSGVAEVEPESVDLEISLGELSGGRTSRALPDGRRLSFLRLFGLDEDSPFERVDRAALFQPAAETLDRTGVQGTYLILPTLRPFLEPAPIPSEGLTAGDLAALLGPDANRRIYEEPDPFERRAAGLYRLSASVRIRSAGVGASFPLGAFGIREGSERVFLGDRLLRPLVDYTMDYESGMVTLLQPEILRARSPSDRLQVTWEEAVVFRVAPTSVVGMNARVPLGGAGEVDLIGVYQVEREVVNRPRFGAEPGALGMVGARSRFDFDLGGLDAFLSALPGLGGEEGSMLRMDGEVAVSLPDPNISGDAYLDDFDAGDERSVSLISTNWHLGSRPEFGDGAEDLLPVPLNETTAASVVWQHTWIDTTPQGDSVGVFEGLLPQQDIDRQINVAGSQIREPGLQLSFGRDRAPPVDGAGWRSVTTVLSPTGLDLTQTEFLDFYVADGEDLSLIIDVGMVSEDAFFVDAQGNTSGVHPQTGRPWGLGVLDQEGDPLRGEVWSPALDAVGLWNETCEAEPGRIYPLGDARANCTRGNGRRDTEDLNRNGVLDETERTVRYVVPLAGTSPFQARNRIATGTRFRLFRVPLRGDHAVNPGGRFTEGDWRGVQFIRITVVGESASQATLARMRLVGSRWIKRNVEGVLTGIAGDTLALGGRLEVTPVSVLSEGAAYQAPPGVLERLDDPTAAVGGRGVEFNERSLGLRYSEIGPGERVEVYHRFLQRPRNFLSYGQLRLWALARRGDWGPGTATDFFLKVGSDPENFYMYRIPLEPAANPEGVTPGDWLPERLVEFEEWITLRRRAELRLIQENPGPGDPPVVEWSADSTYAVVLKDRARAPNLSAVREISMGVWNRNEFPVSGELWVNELRLGRGLRAGGTAAQFEVELAGGGFLEARMDFSSVGPNFQQLEERPSFQGDGSMGLSTTLQMGRMLPEDWGWNVPVSVSYRRMDQDPFYLEGTDLRADLLPGLRTAGFRETRVTAAFGAMGETGRPVLDAVLSGLDVRVASTRSSGTTATTETRARGGEASVGYIWRFHAREVGVLPDFLDPLARVFIPWVILQRLREAQFRWTPEELSVGTTWREHLFQVTRYDQIVVLEGADPGSLDEAPEAWLDNRMRIGLRPFRSLAASLSMHSTRDLLEVDRGVRDVRVRPVVADERRELFGTDLGWEVRREVTGRLTWQPPLPGWLRSDLGFQTRYRTDRNAGLVRFDPDDVDEPRLLRNAGGERDLRISMTLDPEALFGATEPSPEAEGSAPGRRILGGLGRTVSPINLTMQDGITSRFNRELVDPGTGFQLGWGGIGSFRELDGIRATTLVDRWSLSAGSGLRLPATLFMNLNYRNTEIRTLDLRSDRDSRERAWPDVRAGFGSVPLPDGLETVLQRVSVAAGIQRTRRDITFGGDFLQRRTLDDRRYPMEVSLEWVGGITTRYRGRSGRGVGTDPTGSTERTEVDHGISLETRLSPARGLGDQMREPLRLSVLLHYTRVDECRIVAGMDDCVSFVDQVNRGFNLSVDTRVSGMEVGGQLSLVDRRSFTGLRLGNTQFQVGLWGRLIFESGPVERMDRERTRPF